MRRATRVGILAGVSNADTSRRSRSAGIGHVAAAHIERLFRRNLRGPGVTSERGFFRLVTGQPHPFGNLAIVSDPADHAGLKRAIAPLARCGAPAAVLFSGPAAADREAVDLVRGAAFEPHDAMPAMAVDIQSLIPTSLPEDYSLVRIGPGRAADEWTQTMSVGYGLPLPVAELFSPDHVGASMAEDAPLQYFGVRHGERVVCTSLLYLEDGVAGVYCVATVPEERGRGLGGHATAEPLRLAQQLRYTVGVLQSSAEGHSMYRKLGFKDVGEVPMFIRMPA